ncbi:MAG: hypothetical protein QM704_05910 [Anaeromyxobacteraceae bacterium]
MSRSSVAALCAAAAIAVSGTARAAPEDAGAAAHPALTLHPPVWRGPASAVLSMGWDAGGEELFRVGLSDGSTQRLDANSGFWMQGGLAFAKVGLGPVGLETTATFGFKYKRIGVDDDGIRYLAFPLEVTERASLGALRLGVGVSLALGPSLATQGILMNKGYDVELQNSLGLLFELDFISIRARRDQGWLVGVRYHWQQLASKELRIPVDANAFGLVLGLEL